MFESLDRGVRSWIAGLTGALIDVIDAVRPPLQIVARRSETGDWTLATEDPSSALPTPIAVIRATAAPVMLPEPVRGVLKGADIAIDLPPDWVFRRTLDPVPAKTATFLDVFVRHHIERVTPWRAADTWYTVASAPLPTDPSKISVEILCVARSLLTALVPPIMVTEPHRLRLRASRAGDQPPAEIYIPLTSGNAARATRLRRIVGATVAVVVIAFVVSFGGASWYQSALDSQLDDLDRDISDHEAFLAKARARLARPAGSLSAPERLREQSVPVVDLIETLSAVLPDQVYLSDLSFEAGHIRITGIARDIAGLIPLIERSGRFAEVAFFAPTTRLPNQAGDRFFIEMRVRNNPDPPKSAEAPK